MINQTVLEKEYKRLRDYLKILLSNESVINDLPNSENLRNVVTKALKIFNFIVLNYKNKSEEVNKFVETYKSVYSKASVNLSPTLNFTDEVDLTDEINYINVYIQNIYGKEILKMKRSILNGIKRNTSDPLGLGIKNNNNKPPPSQFQANKDQPTSQRGASQADFAFGQAGAGPNSQYGDFQDMFTPEGHKKLFATSMASQRLNNEVLLGKFYLYNKKPPEIPFIKYVIGFILVSIAILSIVLIGLVIRNNDLQVSADVMKSIYGGSDATFATQSFWPVIPVGFLIVPLILFFVIMLIIWSIIKGFKNPNKKYFIEMRQILYLLLVIILFAIFGNVGVASISVLRYARTAAFIIAENPSSVQGAAELQQILLGIYGIFIAILGSIGLTVCAFILGKFLNPKRDNERIQKTLEQYSQEILRSKTF